MTRDDHFENEEPSEPLTTSNEHASMECIREVLRQYQLQSPAHFELGLEVHQLTGDSHRDHDQVSTATIRVLFQGRSISGRISIPANCCVVLRTCNSKVNSWDCTVVAQNQNLEAPEHFLSTRFPTIDAPLQQDTLWRWWGANGRKSGWTNLPTELKEHIVEFCMHQPSQRGIYNEKLARYDRRYKPNSKMQNIGPLEIVEQLGDWYQLLYVSHQVRAITLRLCLFGGSSLAHPEGLCIVSHSYKSFSERINRLGDYYQMIEPYSIPITSREEALSKCYRRFPTVYLNLKQYATFRHGIQKISLEMDWMSFIHFFKVKAGGFQHHQKTRGLTYHVFERLPSLNEIMIWLPRRPRGGWKNKPHPGGLQLFHREAPCPRSLHRLIYERVAEVLAPYNVSVRGFIDEEETQRFESARLEAVKVLKFTKTELEDLYADNGGGIELPHTMERVLGTPKTESEKGGAEWADDLYEGFSPPVCHCEEPCAWLPALCAFGHR
ncbi:hypothetical protein EKO04_002935 [Ascochyta lentis]|uniref:Uncharacterized protein n=1 Tax=Ascochyta lentis TaxID=205686 RepID=A0A8H7JB35_9PLEO|nr:hypothetical protein EKO04_002935 [Ascochyta lentis]